VIFVSAKGEEIDKVLGLELGADDFVVKPFGVREVLARIRAVTRRASRAGVGGEQPFEIGDLRVEPAELRAYRGARPIPLTVRDVRLLRAFAAAPGRVLDRDTLFDAGWGIAHLPASRTLDQHISQLRKRIEADPRNPKIIRTVHTAGYRYEP
jgi:DNA-binding response OmpR family regulator